MKRFALVAALLVVGCSNHEEQCIRVVREGRALLRHPPEPKVRDAEWEARRLTFLADADAVAPVVTKKGS